MRRRRGLALLALAVAAGCGRCGGERAAAPERHLPRATAAVVLPVLEDSARQLAALAGTLARFPAAASLPDRRAELAAQLGLDPLDPKALRGAGLDERGGAALARTPSGWVAALPLRDRERFHETIARLARDRLGAAHVASAPVDGVPVTAFATAAGAPPALAYALASGLALVGPGPGGGAAAAAAARLAEGDSLAASPEWRRARAALPARAAVVAFAPPGAWPTTAAAPLRDGAALAIGGDADSLDAAVALLLPPPRHEAWRALVAPGRAPALDGLPRDAFAAAAFGGDPALLVRRLWWAAPERVRARAAAAGVDVERELAALLAPGAAAALSVAPTFEVAAVPRGASALAGSDPFRLLHLGALATARDDAAGRAALERLARLAPALGAEPRAARDGELTLSRGRAALELAARGGRIAIAGGAGRLAQLLAPPPGGGFSPPREALEAVAGAPASAVLDFGALLRSARALPAQAYGTGPDGFVLRSLAERALDPASRLEWATLRLDVVEGAARISLRVKARPGAEARP
jgi:hypothetical protein